MARAKLSLDDIDRFLDGLGGDRDDETAADAFDDGENDDVPLLHRPSPSVLPLDYTAPTRPSRGRSFRPVEAAPHDAEDDPEPGRRATPNLRTRRAANGRPADLPPLQVPPGYRLDPRGTWRRADGSAVPGAKTVTLANRWSYGRRDPVVVPASEVALHPELRWCRTVGELCSVTLYLKGRRSDVLAFRVDTQDWQERAHWPLALIAPELEAGALVSLSGVADWLGSLGGKVSVSTLRAYLARGRMPVPQFHLNGAPLWSAPVLLAWLRDRPGSGPRRAATRPSRPGGRKPPSRPVSRRAESA